MSFAISLQSLWDFSLVRPRKSREKINHKEEQGSQLARLEVVSILFLLPLALYAVVTQCFSFWGGGLRDDRRNGFI